MNKSILRAAKSNIILVVSSYKILFIFVVACIMPLNSIYQLRFIGQFSDLTVFDGMIYEFGLFTIHYLIFVPCCIFVIYDLVKPNLIDNFVFSRISGRKGLFISKMLSCVIMSLILLCIMGLISFVTLSFNFQVDIRWGSGMLLNQSYNESLINHSLINCSPLFVLSYQFLLVLLSLISTSWLLLLFMEVIKRKSFALVATMLLNFLILVLSKENGADRIVLPCANTFISNVDISQNGCLAIIRPIVYWVIIGGLIFLINRAVLSRKDFLYEDSPEAES